MTKQEKLFLLAKLSLALLWFFTGLTSILLSPEIGYQILANAGITGAFADLAVYGGGLLDMLLAVWLLSNIKLTWCCWMQICVICVYSLLLSIIDASFWLHPFGPLTKNIPVLVLILFVINGQNERLGNR